MRNVFDWLDDIREKPGLYLRDRSLYELESLIHGYYTGLSAHCIVEGGPQMGSHFLTWFYCRTKWASACGWAFAIGQRYPDSKKAFAKFFKLVDEYRTLKPTVLFSVELAAHHNPTGKRDRLRVDKLLEKPLRVDILRYRPESLHFLRFHYPNRVENREILMTGNGEYATTVKFAKQWVRDKFQVELRAWKKPAK